MPSLFCLTRVLSVHTFLVSVVVFSSTVYAQNQVECIEGPIVELGDELDLYYQQFNSCTYGNIFILDETIEDSRDCKFTCHNKSYFLIDSDQEVALSDLFKNKEILLSRINKDLKNDFYEVKSQNEECFEGIVFEKVDFRQLTLSFTESGFHFLAESGVPGYCKGPAGEISSLISFEEIEWYLK